MIVTGFSVDGYRQYGERLVSTLSKFAPYHPTMFYATDFATNQKTYRLLEDRIVQEQNDIPDLKTFVGYYGIDPLYNGRLSFKNWNEKERKTGYSYRFDAVKFCKMVFVMQDAAYRIGRGHMIWLDGDNVVRKKLPHVDRLTERALNGCDFAYLGREPKHSETGFLVFKLPECLPILDEWARFYRARTFIDQKEWHSAYLFDRARELHPNIKGNNLTPGGRGHVIHQCWVGEYFDHCKGNRKRRGRSLEAKK